MASHEHGVTRSLDALAATERPTSPSLQPRAWRVTADSLPSLLLLRPAHPSSMRELQLFLFLHNIITNCVIFSLSGLRVYCCYGRSATMSQSRDAAANLSFSRSSPYSFGSLRQRWQVLSAAEASTGTITPATFSAPGRTRAAGYKDSVCRTGCVATRHTRKGCLSARHV